MPETKFTPGRALAKLLAFVLYMVGTGGIALLIFILVGWL